MSPGTILILCLALLAWLVFAAACHALHRMPRRDVRGQLVWAVMLLVVRLIHRVRYTGLELIPPTEPTEESTNVWKRRPAGGPLIIVANHTAGIDPLLIHAACPFHIRWMMLRTMMPPSLNWFWDWLGIIAVGPTSQDAQAARIAIRHLKDGSGGGGEGGGEGGGVIGVFPEGGIARPYGCIMPFEPGVGLLVSRSKARVLLAVIDGTPDAPNAYLSLCLPSRARVRFLALIDYAHTDLGASEIAADLRERARRALNWPLASGWETPSNPARPAATTDSGVK